MPDKKAGQEQKKRKRQGGQGQGALLGQDLEVTQVDTEGIENELDEILAQTMEFKEERYIGCGCGGNWL